MFSNCGPWPETRYIRSALTRRNVFHPALTGFVLLLFTVAAGAAQRVPLTLAEAEDLALKNEPGQLAMQARAEALEELSVAAGELPDPTLRVGLANFPVSSGGFTTEAMTQAQLGIRQAFPRRKSRLLSKSRFRSLAKAQYDGAGARSLEVLTATRIAWLETFYWQNAERVLEDSKPFFQDLVDVTESMYSVGRRTQYDVLRAELELSRIDDRVIDAGRSRSVAQSALSQWLGSDARRPLAANLPKWEQVPQLGTLLKSVADHPLLRAAEAEIAAHHANVGIAEQNKKPGWALDLGYGFRDGFLSNGEPRSDFVSLSVVVDLPVFKKNRQDRKLAAALGERRAALSSKDKIELQLRSELESEHAQWTQLTRRIALYQTRILELSQKQTDAALLAYQSDAGNFSDVMFGHIDHLDTRLEQLRLQVERAQSYAVLANLGGLPR